MKKVLFIHHAQGWGGAPINMINIINSLNRTKYKADVLLLKNSIVADKLKENNINFFIAESTFYNKYYQYFTHSEAGYLRWYNLYRFIKLSFLWLASRYYFAKKELEKYEYDIIHLNSSVLTDWLAPANKYGKVIIHIQEPFRRGRFDILHTIFITQMRKNADYIIAISEDNAKRINIPEKTIIIYNYTGISSNQSSQSSEKSYSSKKVLYLGGNSSIKGFYTLSKALDYLEGDVKVYFGGDYCTNQKTGNIVKSFLYFILCIEKEKNLAIRRIHGHSNAIVIGLTYNVSEYLEEVCCLVSPFSVSHFARPVIEAYMHKKPVIGSNVPGMDEIIEHNVTGLIFEKDNPKGLAKAINELVLNAEKAKTMGEKGYEIAVEKFSSDNIYKLVDIYDELTNA